MSLNAKFRSISYKNEQISKKYGKKLCPILDTQVSGSPVVAPCVRLADGAAASLADRLWCPAVSLLRAAASPADHGTLCALAISATGSARARGHCHSLPSLFPFGVPGIFLADKPAASATDPCTRLCSAVSATGSAEQRGRHRQRSGRSPIIQDDKLVGAVTHVLVNDPTTGYGIFIEDMLDAAA